MLLGLLQAATEFLPVSSSGHLVLAADLTGEQANQLTFDVGLHVGTAVAVLAYFWRDWWAMAIAAGRDLARHGPLVSRWSERGRLGWWIVLATVPAVITGLVLDRTVEAHLRTASLVGVLLILGGVVIGVLDRRGGSALGVRDAAGPRAIAIGLAQALALVPGISRSGATIAAARWLGFDRAAAARFSFLLSVPAVAGASALKLYDAVRGDEVVRWGPLLVGAAVSAAAGALAIHWLLRFLSAHTLGLFVWYRIALGLAVLMAVAVGAL